MAQRRYATFLSLLCALSLLLGGFPATAARPEPAPPAPFVPYTPKVEVPPMLLQDLTGNSVRLYDILMPHLLKHFVLLHLWAPSCPPCVVEMQSLSAAQERFSRLDVAIITLAEDPNGLVTVPAFARRYGLASLPYAVDRERYGMKKLGATQLPTTYFIDPEGRIVGQHVGAVDWKTVTFKELVVAPPPAPAINLP